VKLDVLFDDNHVLAVNKPACMPIAPDDSGDESLLDVARAWVEEAYAKPGRAWLGLVHRLDRPVSGVVVFARTSKAAGRLSSAFARREVQKRYVAACVGRAPGRDGEVEQWLWKDTERNRVHVRPAPADGARPEPGLKLARTAWRAVATSAERVLLELSPHTGRPHQLRVCCATLGVPIAGDLKYGAPEALPDRSIALHAERLALIHPVRRTPLDLRAPRPGGAVWRFSADSEASG